MKDRTMRMLWAILLFLKEIGSLQFEEIPKANIFLKAYLKEEANATPEEFLELINSIQGGFELLTRAKV